MDPKVDNPTEPTKPETGKPKVCGARLRRKPGKRCRNPAVMENGRCRLHGGKTPSGPASPHWKHGRTSGKHRWLTSLPKTSLGDRFLAAMADPELANLRGAMALNDAMLTSYTASLKETGKPLTVKQQERVHQLLDMQGKLAEREARRLRDLGTYVTQVQFTMVVNTCMQLFNEFVTDQREKLEVHRRLQQSLLGIGQPDLVKGT